MSKKTICTKCENIRESAVKFAGFQLFDTPEDPVISKSDYIKDKTNAYFKSGLLVRDGWEIGMWASPCCKEYAFEIKTDNLDSINEHFVFLNKERMDAFYSL